MFVLLQIEDSLRACFGLFHWEVRIGLFVAVETNHASPADQT